MLVHWALLGRREWVVDLPGIAATIVSLVVVCILAWFTWTVIETPALRIGHLYRYARAGMAGHVTAQEELAPGA
jgi:peptidoglycan/LPS O-acetylase OafA/YrhL